MNPRKTLALADPLEPELKPDLAADGGAQGPMAQQHTDGSGINELHPQQLPQLVGFRDPDAGKQHEGNESVAASVAAVPAAAA
ncbi:MAG TPA: hypothetical protein VN831_27200 [Bradyrhizobium sp.]|nr:hypothetical protein [Bradyrhizobium sp.]